jgi:hypothetical protein
MADLKPTRLVGNECETLLTLLQFQRDSLVRKVTGVDEATARHSPVASGTTLLWLVKHLAWAETIWVLIRFAGLDVPGADDAVGPDDTLAGVIEGYRAVWSRVDAVVADARLDNVCRRIDDGAPANLRWVLAHLLEETARHAGHADILRELIDGTTGR